MTEWINVRDQKPEVGQLVVAWMQRKQEPICCKIQKDSHGLIWRELITVDVMDDREDLITHWMPLLPPPHDPRNDNV